MSCRAIARQQGCHHSVITRLVQKEDQTKADKDRLRTGRPKTSVYEDRNLPTHLHVGTSGIPTDDSPSRWLEIVSRLQNTVFLDLVLIRP